MIAQNNVANIMDENTMQIGMYLSTLNMVRTFVDRFKPNKIVFALDGPQAGERRRKLYSGYKAGRRVKAKTSSIIIKEGEEEDDYTKYTSQGSFTFQLERIYNFMKFLPITVVVVPYCEGDDLIAHLVVKNKDEYDCIIVSGDHDYCQLVDENVKLYDWRKKKLYTEETFLEEFKVITQNYIYMKILLGDKSDEIKGVKGVGKETFPIFHPVLNNKLNIYENVTEFINEAKNIDVNLLDTREKNVLKKMWSEENIEYMFLLYQIMKLGDNCLKLHHVTMLDAQVSEQESKGLQKLNASLMMRKHLFNKLYNGFDNDKWLQPFVFVKPNMKLKV